MSDFILRDEDQPPGNSARYLIEWLREDDTAADFGTLRYKVDCISTRTTVRDWTNIENPSTPYVLDVSASDLGIIRRRNKVEMKVISVQADFGTKSQKTGLIYVPIRNYYL